ncbi:reverse transcriptase family protein [Nocardia sp. NPDC049149]|uniref:reverse transcriptase family protein n=1 Tax=Nocardia sp. NPDC049149 TaxID=3364315 RepID=UPI0037230080
MSRPALPAPIAARLADEFGQCGGRWHRDDLAEAFAAVLDPVRAEEFAARVIGLMPTEPIDSAVTLRALLTELPALPIVIVQLEPVPNELRFGAPELPDTGAVARMLNLTPDELDWFADHGGWLRRTREPLAHYRYRRIPKKDGVRLVEAPKPRLREMQRTIARRILAGIPAHPSCHGFEKGASAATFAAPHARAAVVVRLDLRHFFPSIGVARVRGVFRACGYHENVATVLADLCTTATAIRALTGLDHEQASLLRAPHLAQGAPTSPRLANLIARNLDRRVSGYARRHGLTYTRYADDLALSGPADTDIEAMIWALTQIIEDEGFEVHRDKTSVRRPHQRQVLAGLVVNDRPAVARENYDALRALLHNCLRTGAAAQNRNAHPNFRAHVYGSIAWIGATSPTRRQKLLDMARRVDWTQSDPSGSGLAADAAEDFHEGGG